MIAPPKTKEQEHRAELERESNARAQLTGQPLPFPNPWDHVDPTKVRSPATDAELQDSYAEFRKICRPRARKQHRL